MRHLLPNNGEWIVLTDEKLLEMNKEGGGARAQAELLRSLIAKYEANRLAYFLAHGKPRPPDPVNPLKRVNDVTAFLNDRESDMAFLLGPNRSGKTYAAVAWLALRTIPCDKSWDCFRPEFGLDWHPWQGPGLPALVASFQVKTVKKALWRAIQEIFPEDELKEYSLSWVTKWNAKNPKKKRVRPISWGAAGPGFALGCGNLIDFGWYSSGDVAFESIAYARVLADEQIQRNKLDALRVKGRNFDDFQMAFSLTPVAIAGMPETGSASWISEFTDPEKRDTAMKCEVYRITVDSIPDAIWSKETKEQEYQECIVIPQKRGDRKMIAKGRARYYAEIEQGAGRVYDEWDAAIHWIDPFPKEVMERCLKSWTLYRGLDHGKADPCVCLRGMVSPWGDLILYGLYYQRGKDIAENVLAILAQCGNRRMAIAHKVDEKAGATYTVWQEQFVKEHFAASYLDCRSFASPGREGYTTLGQVYNGMGLRCIPAPGTHLNQGIPMVREYLAVHPERTHIQMQLKLRDKILIRGELLKGAPKLYVLATPEMLPLRQEIEAYNLSPNTDGNARPEEPDKRCEDHALDALRYMIEAGPIYRGNVQEDRQEAYTWDKPSSGRTGY